MGKERGRKGEGIRELKHEAAAKSPQDSTANGQNITDGGSLIILFIIMVLCDSRVRILYDFFLFIQVLLS